MTLFAGDYIDWNHKKIKFIIEKISHNAFFEKQVLDLGSGYGDVASAFSRLGADVLCVDARQEHLNLLTKKHPHLKTVNANLDKNWPFKNRRFNFVLSLGILCHLKNFEQNLRDVCESADNLVLETEVFDSDDPNKVIFVEENKKIYDWSFEGCGAKPSAAYIERILNECGMNFKRYDDPKLNSGPYKYDWQVKNTGNRLYGHRRFWICSRKSLSLPFIAPPPIVQEIPPPPTVIPRKNMRVAICLSGHLRTFKETFESLRANILSRLNCDIFVHSWNDAGTNLQAIRKLYELYRPVKCVMENKIVFNNKTHPLSFKTDHDKNIISMFYKIKACNDLKSQYEKENNFKYDIVFRCRFDALYNHTFEDNELKNLDGVYFPRTGHFGGINDQFAFGNSNNMDVYSSVYDKLEEYSSQGICISPEMLLKHHIFATGLKPKYTEINYDLLKKGFIQNNYEYELFQGSDPLKYPPF
jgi:SAM-dependent methyltransferase